MTTMKCTRRSRTDRIQYNSLYLSLPQLHAITMIVITFLIQTTQYTEQK
jgi:hypothetical protein